MMFFLYVAFLDFHNLVYVDETGLNREYKRLYARAKRGVKIYDKKLGKRQKRTNIIAGLCNGKHLAVQCYEHSTNSVFFEDWFEFELIPLLPENAIIVLDNASFHRKNVLWDIAHKYDIYLLFLPPYSPEFNKIEQSWANFKAWLKYNSVRFSCFDFAVKAYFY